MKLVLIIFLMQFLSYSQTDLHRWGKSEIAYVMSSPYIRTTNDTISTNSITETAVSSIINFYRISISDVDGDNCAFSPTCSEFFIESVKETNIFQAIIMFSDRLTRDTDFIGRELKYPLLKNGKFYDVPSNYRLDSEKINYIPPSVQ